MRALLIKFLKGRFQDVPHLEIMPMNILLSYLFERSIMLLRGLLYFRKLCFVGKGVKFKCRSRIKLGRFVTIHDYSYIDASALRGIVIEDYCTIGRNNYLRTGNLSSYQGYFIMKKRSLSNNNCFLGATGGITIGENVMIGPNVTIITEMHRIQEIERSMRDQGVESAPVVIENDTWIGANSVILGGTVIETGVVVGAGSVVTKSVKEFEIVAGNPARVIRKRNN